MADFFNANPRTMDLLRALGLIPKAPAKAQTPNPFNVPYTGLKNEMYPPAVSDADMALPTMALPAGPLAPPSVSVRATPPTMPPVTVAASPDPLPARQSAADYGPAWNTPAAPNPYSHLNPTPSLEEIYRREYAANPNGFTPGRFFGLLG